MDFKITISASREKVWHILWDDANYRKWTSVFTEGSWAKTDWQKGSKALFLDAKNSGMVSEIADNVPNEYMSIRHLGIVKEGVEDTSSTAVKEWAGAEENYSLTDVSGKTELGVHMTSAGMNQKMVDYFASVWPKALDKIKELAEEQ